MTSSRCKPRLVEFTFHRNERKNMLSRIRFSERPIDIQPPMCMYIKFTATPSHIYSATSKYVTSIDLFVVR